MLGHHAEKDSGKRKDKNHKRFCLYLLAGITALALLFQNLQGFPGLASLRLNPVQKERERIVLRESVRVVVVNL